ncbi:hypothetical protein [Nonomuraea guangzhouensis]|uniref:Uncharacterized protein n=1 Tax=Nonomuraea guangzhouensis TaxID=1291555 RepID=A0ABW4GWB9_9ACTN|nr:hypothetical protein [Nonomuraea guangzhouensis]
MPNLSALIALHTHSALKFRDTRHAMKRSRDLPRSPFVTALVVGRAALAGDPATGAWHE